MTPLERVLECLQRVRRSGSGFEASCPVTEAHAHGDRKQSLSVTEGDDGRVLLKCHGGCEIADVLAALDLTTADLFPKRERAGRATVVAEYDYRDERGNLLFQVVRLDPKGFRQRRPDGSGGWEWTVKGTRRVLYRLPRVVEAADRGETVYVVEGEKDVHAVERAGGVATCSPMGGGKWDASYSAALAGAHVVVVSDRDDKGREHARLVEASVASHAASVRIVRAAEGHDASDHLAVGHGLDDFVRVEAEEEEPEPDTTPKLSWLRTGEALLLQPDPGPVDWLVEGLLVDLALGAIQGAYKTGKSWLVLALALAIVTGRDALGRFTVPNPGPAIVILEESPERETHRRLDQLRRAYNLPPEALADLHLASNQGIVLAPGSEWRERLIETAREISPRAVFLDPLVRLKGEEVDENVQSEIVGVLHFMRDLRREVECAAIFTHHVGHRDQGRMRGSSDIEAFWSSKIITRGEKNPRRLEALHRDAAPSDGYDWDLSWHEQSRTMRVEARGGPSTGQRLRDKVHAHVTLHPGQSRNTVAREVGGKKTDVLDAIRKLIEARHVEERDGGLYAVVPPTLEPEEPGVVPSTREPVGTGTGEPAQISLHEGEPGGSLDKGTGGHGGSTVAVPSAHAPRRGAAEDRPDLGEQEGTSRPAPRVGVVYVDADLPDERLRVVAVEGDDVRLRVESRNGRSGEHVVVPASAIGTQLRRVA